jgi:hypothetical protein
MDLPARVLAAALDHGAEPSWSAQVEALGVLDQLPDGWHLCCGTDCGHGSHAEPLDSEAHARSGDPDASKLAAASIDNLPARYGSIIGVAASLTDPWTYDRLCRVYADRAAAGLAVPQQPSSIRSRCATLRKARWVAKVGTGRSDAGHPATLWTVNPERLADLPA